MKLKKRFLLPVLLVAGLIASPAFAEEIVSNGNYPMGYFIQQQELAQLAQENLPAPEKQIAPESSPSTSESDETAETATPMTRYTSSAIKVQPLSHIVPMLNPNEAALPRRDAVDIASYQSWMTQADFNALKSAGVKTIVVKLTEGESYTNPYASSQINMAKAAGLNIATYHFVSNPARIQYEAAYYAKTAKNLGLPSTTVMIEDAEFPSTAYNWTNASLVFKNTMASNGYPNVRYYTSQSWVLSGVMNASSLGARNLWVAQYPAGTPSSNPSNSYNNGWKDSNTTNSVYGAWQYTSQMYFQGTASLRSHGVDTSVDYNNIFAPVESSSPSGYKNIYRLYNTRNMEHLYTQDANEKNQLPNISKDWKYEGIAWYSPNSSNAPVYRVYNPKSGEHLYTRDSNEINVLSSKYGWKKEGTAFYSGGNTPVYRLFNAAAGVGSHFVTTSLTEKNSLASRGWKYEGIAWYAK